MIRLHITAEGQTEERFVKQTLSSYLASAGIFADVRCVLTSRDKKAGKSFRGGFRLHDAYGTVRKDILAWMREDNNPECRFSTMFDFYALPEDFPGMPESARINDKYKQVEFIEKAFASDIGDPRFIPYIQLHEFEALIFTEPSILIKEYPDRQSVIAELDAVCREYPNPELINSGAETAPSKRIIKLIPEHQGNKTSVASLVGMLDMQILRSKCCHFNDWLAILLSLR